MEYGKLLSVILLAVGLCFVSAVGYGEIEDKEYLLGTKARNLEFELLLAKVNDIRTCPDSFL